MSYTTTGAMIGKGVTLSYGGTPTLIGEIVKISAPRYKVPSIDATNSSSTVAEVIPGIKAAQEITVEVNYITSQATTLDAISGVVQAWVLTKPDTHTYTFQGFLSDIGDEIPVDGKISVSLKIMPTGTITSA